MSVPIVTVLGKGRSILFCRLPGLLANAAQEGYMDGNRTSSLLPHHVPLVVAEGRVVRDACPQAAVRNIRAGSPVTLARRLCPTLRTVSVEEIDARRLFAASARFWDILAPLTPTIEPDGPDALYADFSGGPMPDTETLRRQWEELRTGLAPILAFGPCRNAARACAECGLLPESLADADARWLWPEDPLVVARLFRLGLVTYGQIAALGEAALVYQFGKTGRLLYRRSVGKDFAPIRPLWPPPTIETAQDFMLEPISDAGYLKEALRRLAEETSRKLEALGRFARRLSLILVTERGRHPVDWVLPLPVQEEREIVSALRRMRQQVTLAAPVTRLVVTATDLDLPPATTGSLFDDRAAERRVVLAATRQKLRSRYGIAALRMLAELPVAKRDVRRELRQARLRT